MDSLGEGGDEVSLERGGQGRAEVAEREGGVIDIG